MEEELRAPVAPRAAQGKVCGSGKGLIQSELLGELRNFPRAPRGCLKPREFMGISKGTVVGELGFCRLVFSWRSR